MSKRLLIAVPVLLIAVGVGAWFEPTQTVRGWVRNEPFFDGRSASYWETALADGNSELVAQTAQKFTAAKSDGVPMLIHLLGSRREMVRINAADLAGKLGADAKSAAPALVEHLEDPDHFVRITCAQSLAAIKPDNPEVVPALIARLKTADRNAIVRPLSAFGPKAKDAVPDLIEMAKSQALAKTRWEAVRTLGKIGPDAKTAVGALIELLKDLEEPVREHAAEALGDIGAIDAVGPLTAALADRSERVRRDSVRALGQLGPAAKSAMPTIEKLANDKSEIVRDAVEIALRSIDPSSPVKGGPRKPVKDDDD